MMAGGDSDGTSRWFAAMKEIFPFFFFFYVFSFVDIDLFEIRRQMRLPLRLFINHFCFVFINDIYLCLKMHCIISEFTSFNY